MGLDGRSAREELWRRYDAGSLTAKELESRLRAVDRAGDDHALQQALDAPLTTTDPRRRALLIGGIAVVLLAAVAVPLVFLDGDADGGVTRSTGTTGGEQVAPITPLGPTVVPQPVADCEELEAAQARVDAANIDEPPSNPALLSDPPALPEGYRVDDDEELGPGTDPDIAMQINAGTPLPVAIQARTLSGDLDVSMRSFEYASADDATAAGRSVLGQGVCTYGAEGFEVPGRPELVGSVVEGPIPPTAFVGFRIGERRFTVSVVAAGNPDTGTVDDEDLEAAKALAATIAGLELDAARSGPGGEQQVGTVPATTIPAN